MSRSIVADRRIPVLCDVLRRASVTAVADACRAVVIIGCMSRNKPKRAAAARRGDRAGRHSAASARRSSAGVWPVAGCDEAGRGPLAGPVVAAAVILDPDDVPRGLDDSKRLTPERREVLYERICARAQVAVALAPPCAHRPRQYPARVAVGAGARGGGAAGRAAAGLRRWPRPHRCRLRLRGGDRRRRPRASIAAASIVAKVTRDRLMALPRRRASRLRLRAPYGLQRARAFRRARPARADHPSPPLVRAGGDRATATSPPPADGPPTYCLCSAARRIGHGQTFAWRCQACPPGSMFYVPLYIEWLRSRPLLAVLARRRWRRPRCGSWCRCCSMPRRPATSRSYSPSATNSASTPASARRSLLARRDRVPHRRPVRRLCAGAALRVATYWCVFALGRIDRRPGPCRDGGAADGRHRRLHGADRRISVRRSWRWRCGPRRCCISGSAVMQRRRDHGTRSASRPRCLL